MSEAARLESFSAEEDRCLRTLRRGDLYEGALALIIGDKVRDPEKVMIGLRKRGLTSKSKGTWSLTETGQQQADLLIAEHQRQAG